MKNMPKRNSADSSAFTLMNRASERSERGFTLIELLVVISIMGILLALSVYGMQDARRASRDGRRKADLEQIRSALEMYKSDCTQGKYLIKATATTLTNIIGTMAACGNTNVYLAQVPLDPTPANRSYLYYSGDGVTYELCASLEQGVSTVTCGSSSNCGGSTCNYKVTSP